MPKKRQIAQQYTSVAPLARNPKSRQRMLNARQVAAYLSVSLQQIYALSKESRIPHYRIGYSLRYRQHEIDAWLERHHVHSLTHSRKPHKEEG